MTNLHPNIAFEMYKNKEISLVEFKRRTKWYNKPTFEDLDRMKQILANYHFFNNIKDKNYDWCNTYDYLWIEENLWFPEDI